MLVSDNQINNDIRRWIYIEFWSPDVATKIQPNINILCRCVPAGCGIDTQKWTSVFIWRTIRIFMRPSSYDSFRGEKYLIC